jgi:predicted CxxxxCH...CXXCH cytochrome family protein
VNGKLSSCTAVVCHETGAGYGKVLPGSRKLTVKPDKFLVLLRRLERKSRGSYRFDKSNRVALTGDSCPARAALQVLNAIMLRKWVGAPGRAKSEPLRNPASFL